MKLANGVTVTEIEDGTVLFDARRGKYWHLNDVGAEVVNGVVNGQQVTAIAREISERTGADEAMVTADCQELLHQLRAAKLVRGKA